MPLLLIHWLITDTHITSTTPSRRLPHGPRITEFPLAGPGLCVEPRTSRHRVGRAPGSRHQLSGCGCCCSEQPPGWGPPPALVLQGEAQQGTTPEGREGAPETTEGAGRQPPSLQGPSGQARTCTQMASSCGSSSPVSRDGHTASAVKQERMRKKAQQGTAQSHPPHCRGPGCLWGRRPQGYGNPGGDGTLWPGGWRHHTPSPQPARSIH